MNIYSQGDVMRRREEIVRIVRDTQVHSQEELLALLKKRAVHVTQPTLSRDLRELGLVKTPNGYVAPGAPVATFVPRDVTEGRFEHLVRDFVVSAEAAGNLVVIKTPAAAAQPVASAIDTTRVDDDVLGTIGGDDTIFVAFRTPASAAAFARRVQQIAGLTPGVASRRRASRP
jgi:transcriptional regulator of arginine metabolism